MASWAVIGARDSPKKTKEGQPNPEPVKATLFWLCATPAPGTTYLKTISLGPEGINKSKLKN